MMFLKQNNSGKHNENLAHVDAATAEAILEEMAKFAQNVTHPLNRTGDEEGATYEQWQCHYSCWF